MAAPTPSKAQQRVLLALLDSDPAPVVVADLAADPRRTGTAWLVVQRLRDAEPKALVKLGKATGALAGTDNSTVPVSLTVAGRKAAQALR